jgi:transglutaminase-like putative cysteine protease
VDGIGWIGFDPTNWSDTTQGRIGEQHVAVAVGRDYRDVPPTRGVYRGATQETLTVDVKVEQLQAVAT